MNSSLPVASLKEDLLRPEAFAPLVRTQTVDLVETHISWVFLLERDVFKVKKPVDLGFLDFRTPEQRRRACEAEVTLNGRLAPHVYRGVVPVRLGDDGLACVGGAGPVVDYAVHMLRLADGLRANDLLREGRLTPVLVDRMGIAIAAFHDRCGSDPALAGFGRPSAILANVEENFTQTRGFVDQYLRVDEVDEIVRWQRAFIGDHAVELEARVLAGNVRDGHGDLRLEHVYVEDEGLTIIDCIEFNDRFRFGDVCSDLAFLSMDLACHGRVDLAERLLASYARASNDFDLYGVVDFYEGYRAYVRGKVAAFVARDSLVDEATRQRAAAEARRYFLLALAAERGSLLQPAVVAVGGVIASGKSTIAERIGEAMSAPIIDADRTRKAMLGVAPLARIDDDAWAGAYDPAFTEKVYREVLRRAEVVLDSGRPVVVDASFRSVEMRRAVRELAMRRGLAFRFVDCRAPVDACKARLVERERHSRVSDGRLAIFDAFCARYEPTSELVPEEHIVLDTTQAVEVNVARLRERLDVWPTGFVT